MPRPARLHVLLVDDDPSVCEALETGLARQYIVHSAATGERACAILQAHPIAAIILDAFLADERGLDLVERFHAISPAPIVVLTGHSSEQLAIQAVRAHVVDYLTKPVDLVTLETTLARLTATPEPSADLVAYMREFLQKDPKRVSSKVLATRLGMSERHFRRTFTAQTGTTPGSYIRAQRLEIAARLLLTTRLTVDRIAQRLGYKTGSQFARVFRDAHGLTPTAYRAQPKPLP